MHCRSVRREAYARTRRSASRDIGVTATTDSSYRTATVLVMGTLPSASPRTPTHLNRQDLAAAAADRSPPDDYETAYGQGMSWCPLGWPRTEVCRIRHRLAYGRTRRGSGSRSASDRRARSAKCPLDLNARGRISTPASPMAANSRSSASAGAAPIPRRPSAPCRAVRLRQPWCRGLAVSRSTTITHGRFPPRARSRAAAQPGWRLRPQHRLACPSAMAPSRTTSTTAPTR